MSSEVLPPISVGVVSHNSEAMIGDCLSSLAEMDYPEYELLFADNASTDATPRLIRECFAGARLLRLAQNRGPNVARNLLLRHAAHRYLLLVEDDTFFGPDAVRPLVAAMTADPSCGIAMPRLVFAGTDTVQYSDIHPHFLGEVTVRNYGKPCAACPTETRGTTLAPGVFLLVDREKAAEIGGFDEYYGFGKEDSDFAFRMTLAGYRNVEVPASVVHHKVKARGMKQVHHQLRNRWYWLLKLFSARTLLAASPALAVHELVTFAFLLKAGRGGAYPRALADFARALPLVLRARRRVRAHRRRSEIALLTGEAILVRGDVLGSGSLAGRLKRGYDAAMGGYWRAVRPLLGDGARPRERLS